MASTADSKHSHLCLPALTPPPPPPPVAKLGVGPHRHVTDSRSQWHGGVQRRDRRFSLSPYVENLQAFTVVVKLRRESLIFAPRIRFFCYTGQCRNVTKACDSPPRGVAHPLPPLSGTKFLINIPSHLSVGNTYKIYAICISLIIEKNLPITANAAETKLRWMITKHVGYLSLL